MIAILNGVNYKFQINADFQYSTFEIFAKHLKTKRVSSITNCNTILSEYNKLITEDDFVQETLWEINHRNTLQQLLSRSIDWFEDKSFIESIEKGLDIDMIEGGWNSSYDF